MCKVANICEVLNVSHEAIHLCSLTGGMLFSVIHFAGDKVTCFSAYIFIYQNLLFIEYRYLGAQDSKKKQQNHFAMESTVLILLGSKKEILLI